MSKKLQQFIQDTTMRDEVRGVLESSFRRQRSDDVTYLAAKMLAIEFLDEGFQDIKRLAGKDRDTLEKLKQPGM